MNSSALRTAAIVAAMLAGSLFPQAQVAAPAIRWLIVSLLFLVFLQTQLGWKSLHPTHALLLLANVAMGAAAWALGWVVGGREVALAAFFAGITPTATAAPVIVSFLKGRVDYVVTAFLITNLCIAALLPLLLPLFIGQVEPALFLRVLTSVSWVVFMPMVLAWVLRWAYPPAATWPSRLRSLSFGLWLLALFLITANASSYIRSHPSTPIEELVKIAALTLVICVANFALGRRIGGGTFGLEASQSLGQKNTTLTIYLALAYASPLVALGPTAYVLWHNVWNSWQLHRAGRGQARSGVTPSSPDRSSP